MTIEVNETINKIVVNSDDNNIIELITQGAQGATGATGAGISAGDKGSLTVAANLIDWTLNDSVVTNAKVSVSAAIAGTKISPDFGSQDITTTGNAVFGGNLTVSGEVTVIDTTTLRVEDKNIELGKVGSPTDITADGGGITLLGDTNHTFNWLNATDSWTSSEHIALPDNKKLQLGDSQDLAIFHDGSNSRIQDSGTGFLLLDTNTLMIRKVDGSETMAKFIANGSAELYYDNSLRLATRSWGVEAPNQTFQAGNLVAFGGYVHVNQDNQPVKVGVGGDLSLFHDGTDSFIENITGNLHIRPKAGEEGIKLFPDGSVYLYYNNAIKLTTASWGVSIWGVAQANNLEASNGYVWVKHDNQPVKVGAGGDLSLLHDGTDSKITNITGNLLIEPKSGETGIKVIPDGGVELYHNNVKRAEALSTSFNIYGKAYVAGEIASFNCRFLQSGTDLFIDNNNGGSANRYTQISGGTLGTSAGLIKLYNAGQVELFHSSTKVAETTAYGLNVTSANYPHLLVTSDANLNEHAYTSVRNGITIKSTEAHLDLIAEGSGTHAGSFLMRDSSHDGFGFVNDFTNKELQLKSFTSSGTAFSINSTGSNVSRLDNCIVVTKDGSVSLFHDGTKKAETVSTGLDVDGNVIANNLIVANGISHEGQTNTNMAFDGSSIKFQSNGVERFSVTQYAVFMAQGFKLAFIASAGENPYIQSFGTNNGDLNIGSGSASMAQFKRNGAVELYHNGTKKAESSSTGWDVTGAVKASTGILFGSATAAANTLDDYEEGTFTPTLEGSSGNPTVTYSTQLGHYTKIGNVVHIQLVIVTTSYTGGGGEWQCGGLPFTAHSTAPASFNLGWNQNNKVNWGANVLSLAPYIAAGTTRIRARKFMSDANTALNLSGFSNSETMVFGVHGSYIAA